MQSRLAYAVKAWDEFLAHSFIISPNASLTCLFGTFVFLQFTVLGLANHAGEGYLSQASRELVYYGLQVFVILGFLLHSLFVGVCPNGRLRRRLTYGVCTLFFLCVGLMLLTGRDHILSLIVSMGSALSLGVLGGAVHFRMSMAAASGMAVGRSMGIGSALAVVMQFFLQIQWGVTPLLPAFLLLAFLLFIYILLGKNLPADHEMERKAKETPPRRIVFAILIATFFILFTCFYNEMIHHLMIQSNYGAYNVYSWPRLMMVPGYLLFAVIGDCKNGKYVPIASLCIMLTALLNVVLAGSQSSYWFNMCLFYFSIAAFTSYYLLTFWRLAPGTKYPALWAPMGRILDSCMVLLTGLIHLSAFPATVVLGFDILGVSMAIWMMAMEGDFNLNLEENGNPSDALMEGSCFGSSLKNGSPSDALMEGTLVAEEREDIPEQEKILQEIPLREPEAVPEPIWPEEILAYMREKYHLTQRETDALRELVLTEDTQAVISERLSIQVKTLQGYVTRLYSKTGASTRVGLCELYHEKRMDLSGQKL